jgi:hypothetical protein
MLTGQRFEAVEEAHRCPGEFSDVGGGDSWTTGYDDPKRLCHRPAKYSGLP